VLNDYVLPALPDGHQRVVVLAGRVLLDGRQLAPDERRPEGIQTLEIVDRAYIMFEGSVQASGTVRELVFNDQVADLYLGPTLTARLRARLERTR
jgi:hypothetical protein